MPSRRRLSSPLATEARIVASFPARFFGDVRLRNRLDAPTTSIKLMENV